MKNYKTGIVVVVFLLLFSKPFLACAPGGSGVIARLSVQGTGQFKVTQEWTGWVEPYVVAFWYLPKGEEDWLNTTIDFEQERWFRTNLKLDKSGKVVELWRGDLLEATYDIQTEGFTRYYFSADNPERLQSGRLLDKSWMQWVD